MTNLRRYIVRDKEGNIVDKFRCLRVVRDFLKKHEDYYLEDTCEVTYFKHELE